MATPFFTLMYKRDSPEEAISFQKQKILHLPFAKEMKDAFKRIIFYRLFIVFVII